MPVAVRLAEPGDRAALIHLVRELDFHYVPERGRHAPERVAGMLDAIETAPGSGTLIALAERDGAPVGLACFTGLHPGSDLGGLLFLKELFVVEGARDAGVGAEMLRFLARFAREHGYGRMDLTTETEDAVRFYTRHGAREIPAKRFIRFDGAALDRLADAD
jgi:GNAT superfamily N-acetyltransferase